MKLVKLTRANQDHSRLLFRNSAGQEHSAVLADHCLAHPLTAVRHLREKGINFRPPAGVVDRHAWAELLRSVRDASFSDGPATVTAPGESDYRAVVSKAFGALKDLMDQGAADPGSIRDVFVGALGTLDALQARAKRPTT